MKNIPTKIRNDTLWKDITSLVEHIYGKIDELVANFPDEQWTTASKLRNAANDTIFYTSQAIGNIAAEASGYDWNLARKNLFSLQSMYIFAGRQKFLELEPEIVIKIDGFVEEIDKRFAASKQDNQTKDKEDQERWLEKYSLWQKMQEK